MLDFIKKTLLVSTGLALMTTERLQEFVNELVKKGELTEKEAKEALDDFIEKSKQTKKDLEERTEKIVNAILNRLNVPTRKELEEIKGRLDRLEKSAAPKE